MPISRRASTCSRPWCAASARRRAPSVHRAGAQGAGHRAQGRLEERGGKRRRRAGEEAARQGCRSPGATIPAPAAR